MVVYWSRHATEALVSDLFDHPTHSTRNASNFARRDSTPNVLNLWVISANASIDGHQALGSRVWRLPVRFSFAANKPEKSRKPSAPAPLCERQIRLGRIGAF
jgi:hypothetical protein